MVFLGSQGRAYTIEAAELPPGRGDGAPVSSLVDVQGGAQIRHMIVAKPDANLLVASTGGYGFIAKFGDLLAKKRGGKEFMTLEPGEEPLPPFQFHEAPAKYVAALSEQGRLLLFSIAEMRELAKGRGVIIMGLEKGEKLVAVAVSDQRKLTVIGSRGATARANTGADGTRDRRRSSQGGWSWVLPADVLLLPTNVVAHPVARDPT